MASILDAASGRWPELLQALAGLSPDDLCEREGPCPSCRAKTGDGGHTRFKWDSRRDPAGGWFCSHCGGKDGCGGGGSGVDLLMRIRGWSLQQALSAVERHLGLEPAPAASKRPQRAARPHRVPDVPPPGTPPPAMGRAVAQYPYGPDRENPWFWIQRFRLPPKSPGGKPGKRFLHRVWLDGRWHYPRATGLDADPFSCEWPSPRPLFRLPELLERPDAPALVVEGEGKALAAARLFPDLVAVSWSNGGKAIAHVDWSPLRGRDVTLWPDADPEGVACMTTLAGILHGLGAAVSVVEPPAGVPKGWDLADADWSPEQAARELEQRAQPWEPPAAAAEPGELPGPSGAPAEPPQLSYRDLLSATLDAVRQDDEDAEMELRAEIMTRFRRNDGQITAALFRLLAAQSQDGPTERPTYRSIDLRQVEGLDWLLEGFLPDRDQALLFAPAGAGKTTAALGMAFAVIDGTGFLDHDTHATGGNVLLIASDSGPAPVVRALADMGRGNDPSLSPTTKGHRLHCWAHDASQGAMAWEASLRGCLALLRFVQEESIALVVIDSCKAVTSKCDLNYCDNGQVTALLTWVKEVLCRHTSVLWINHEGAADGTAAGAKAWKEVPSIVHSIELVPAGPEDDSKPKRPGGRQGRTSTVMRTWKVRKCRQGTAREFLYQVDTLTGRLQVATGVELKRDCRAAIVDVLAAALSNGVSSLHRKAIGEELGSRFGYSRGTVSNGLTRVTGGRDPEVVRVGSLPGHYRLSDHWLEVARRAGTGFSE